MDTCAPVLPSVRMGIPVAETSGVAATAPSAAAPRKSRRETDMAMLLRKTLSRFADKVQQHRAPVRRGAVFEEIHSLPGAQQHPAALHRDGNLCQRERGTNVRGHIVGPFDGVAVEAI